MVWSLKIYCAAVNNIDADYADTYYWPENVFVVIINWIEHTMEKYNSI